MEPVRRLSCREAKEIDMVDYLYGLGHEPVRMRRADYWYYSPLRQERTPSFKVNRNLNRWYDHGIGRGGSLIDFGLLYFGCTVSELLEKLSGHFSFHPQPDRWKVPGRNSKITIVSEGSLGSPKLWAYLQHRRISKRVAMAWCREVRYRIGDRSYYAIGWRNDAGGYELRNPFFKGSSSPKAITSICNGASKLKVFEGFMDFLSDRSRLQTTADNHTDYLILNSLAFVERARPFMEQYTSVVLYLDRDSAGQNCRDLLIGPDSRYQDGSGLYDGYKDYNDWWMQQ